MQQAGVKEGSNGIEKEQQVAGERDQKDQRNFDDNTYMFTFSTSAG